MQLRWLRSFDLRAVALADSRAAKAVGRKLNERVKTQTEDWFSFEALVD